MILRFLLIPLFLLLPYTVQGQFIHFQMSVEPELSADVIQNLNFGTFISNSGTQRIEKGSPGMGIFEIRGLQNQRVAVTLNPPTSLTHTSPGNTQQIPVSLEASYANNNLQNVAQARPFIGNKTGFAIGGNSQPNPNQPWQSAYVYIYGSVTIGQVTDGTYEGTLVLTVEYQ